MQIGLYFGSFNPIHVGHLIIANFIVNECGVEQVWFVISPQNPLKPQKSLLDKYHRKELIELAIEGENRLRTSTIEFSLPLPSYTIDTLAYLKEKYTEHTFFIIMGSDSFRNLNKWKNFEQILNDNVLLVYERKGFPFPEQKKEGVKFLQAPILDISSTRIRQMIQEGKSIKFWVPDAVKEEIARNHYYK